MRGLAVVRNAVAAAIVTAGLSASAAAAPLAPGTSAAGSKELAAVTQVYWRGHRGGGAGVAAGLMTGLIIGGLMAAPPYYGPYGPYPYYYPGYYPPRFVGSDWEAYCFSRYRSFDPVSGTYLGFDGRRHYCR